MLTFPPSFVKRVRSHTLLRQGPEGSNPCSVRKLEPRQKLKNQILPIADGAMSNSRASSGDGGKPPEDSTEATIARTAGFVVFSGIAMSILKTLNPFNKDRKVTEQQPLTESAPSLTQTIKEIPPPPRQEPIITKKPSDTKEQNVQESSPRTIDIVRGDTLWGLSRKYGVSVDAIKEANGLTGDTIYAGKKLIIP